MAVKGAEIENWLSHWLLEKKGIMKNSLKSRKIPVLEPEENNCQMKLLVPSFWGFESLPGGNPSCQICISFWGTLAENYWQWNSWNFWKQLNLSILHCWFVQNQYRKKKKKNNPPFLLYNPTGGLTPAILNPSRQLFNLITVVGLKIVQERIMECSGRSCIPAIL